MLATVAGCWLEGAFDLKEISALTGLTVDEFEKLTADPAFVERVNRTRAMPNFGPFLARLKAKRAIKTAVSRLEDILSDPDASAASITKAAELLYSVSQMRSEDAVRDRHAPTGPGRMISIHFGDKVVTLNDTKSETPAQIEELP